MDSSPLHSGRARTARRMVTLALLLTACAGPDDDAPRDTSGSAMAPDTAPTLHGFDDVALEQSCTNVAYGFSVEYPRGWLANGGDGLPPCSAFDPRDVDMPAASEIPTAIAIVITREMVSFGQVTDFANDPSLEVLSIEETIVDGRRAVVAELEHTGEGLYDRGHRQFAYFTDVGQHTLIAVTHGGAETDPPTYAERKRILEAMMAALRFRAAS
jgi:hypothetical protein